MTKKISLLLSLIILFSCNNSSNQNKNKVTEQIQNNTLKIDKTQNYEFIQGNDKLKSKEILIVAIDAHADGKLAISKFEKVLENYNCTVIGLNDVENGQTDFLSRINNDINSAKENLKIEPKKVFICGYSGGARMAIQYSMNNSSIINGVIMCGAGVDKNQYHPFPLVMIIGTKDFNFLEQYYSPYSQYVTQNNLLTLSFNGIHEWPSEELIYEAISFLFLKNGIINTKLYSKFNQKADEFEKSKDYFLAFKYYEAALKSCNNSDKQQITSTFNNLLNQKEFMQYIHIFEQTLNQEVERNNKLITELETKDFQWWKNELQLIKKESEQSNKIEAYSYSRTKAFLGIVMYTFCNREINNQYSTKIDKYLQIYELLEPNNTDLQKFKAKRNSQKTNN